MCEKVILKRSIPVVKATTRLRSAIRNFVALSFVAEWAIFQRLTQILGALGLDQVSSTQWIHINCRMDCAVRKRIADWRVQEARTEAVRRADKSSFNILAKMKERA